MLWTNGRTRTTPEYRTTSMVEVSWKEIDNELRPVVDHIEEVAWARQLGSQTKFLECPTFEVLYEGPRGNGKTDALVMDFAQHVECGYGAEWRGILFRQTYPQLMDVVEKTKKWFPRIFPSACFNESKMTWRWPTGESLRLSYMEREADYWNYHGFSYPWIGFEELTTWPSDKCYRVMMSCSRSTLRGLPRKYRATTNPYGKGHNWVKARFHLPLPPGKIVGPLIAEDGALPRRAIHGELDENRILLNAEPDYRTKIETAARNPSEKKAWVAGSWDVVSGGMFDDLWTPAIHVIPDIPFKLIPIGWRVNRSYDYGQSKPFSVGWWAVSNGEPITCQGKVLGSIKGDLYRIMEWYGWDGTPNEGLRMLSVDVADGIVERERLAGFQKVYSGPADSSIFDEWQPGKSIAGDMSRRGIRWNKADKGPGSRKQGWEQIRKMLKNAIPGEEGIREEPGLFVCARCDQFIRTFPALPRDAKDPDDVDTDAEDHIADEVRYRVREKSFAATSWSW